MTVSSHTTPSTPLGDAEVSARVGRRRFTVEYKTRIVQEAAQYRAPGEIGSLLRREGLYSSPPPTLCSPTSATHDAAPLRAAAPSCRVNVEPVSAVRFSRRMRP